jgi:hypothetical protein
VPRLGPKRLHQAFPERQHIFQADERGFDVDLGEFRLAVGPEVLVTKAPRDLEIAVEPSHHEQLLVKLGRLGQREELPRMHPAGNQVVAGTLWSGLGKDRGFDLEEAVSVEVSAGGLHQPMAEDQIAV